jgi:hypothetical protein
MRHSTDQAGTRGVSGDKQLSIREERNRSEQRQKLRYAIEQDGVLFDTKKWFISKYKRFQEVTKTKHK